MVKRFVPESYIREMMSLTKLFFKDGLSWEEEMEIARKVQRKDSRKGWYLYYQSQFWKIYRLIILQRDGFMCQECGSKNDLQVDHIQYPGIVGKERPGDLRTLCLYCHAKKTTSFDLLASVSQRGRVKVGVDDEMFMYHRR